MIPFTEALERLFNAAGRLPVERVSLAYAAGRVVATPIIADRDLPPFPKAAMDGYAVRSLNHDTGYTIAGEQMAGEPPLSSGKENECIKIMTGAHVDSYWRYIVPFEEAVESGRKMQQTRRLERSNICLQAEDVRKDERLIDKGTLIKPQHIGLMASVGVDEPLVYQRPSVGILSTGDELVAIPTQPNQQQIRNSNGIQLASHLNTLGISGIDYGIVKDQQDNLATRLKMALKAHDVVLLSGGVSKGDKDYVPQICERLGVEELFHGIAVKPGRPTYCGRIDKTVVIGLPGNPVSVFVQFELLVKPFLYKVMGHNYEPSEQKQVLGENYIQKKATREVWLPVTITDGIVYLSPYNGSGDQVGLVRSNALMRCPAGVNELKKGDYVTVRSI
ncbi:MAG: molybdopterin molybdotransferase MoeA [Bacteroidales bacterium]